MSASTDKTGTSGTPAELYKKLAGRLGIGKSEIVEKIWAELCDEDEARLMLALPGTVETIAIKTGESTEDTERKLSGLYHKGVVFERIKDGATTYNPPRNFIQFHDASIQWQEAPVELLDLWKEFMESEYSSFLSMIKEAGLGPFMRIIPINRSIQAGSTVLPYEKAAQMIADSAPLAVAPCPCRKAQRNCDAPLEVCIQMNRGAEYVIKRGTGREITKEEAISILNIAEEAGLVHLTESRPGIGNVLCNCCPCCCMALKPLIQGGNKTFAEPSRFLAEVDSEKCTGCGLCEDRCHAEAISESDKIARIEDNLCIGCGLCASACPSDAIALKEIRNAPAAK